MLKHRGGTDFVLVAWGSASASTDIFDNKEGKMVHSNAIWNANVELQIQVENKREHVFLHYLERFVTSEKILKARSKMHAFWIYLKRFGILKNKVSKAYILTLFGTSENCFKSKVSKACILILFGTSWNYIDHFENKVAKDCLLTLFSRYLKLQ